VWLSENFGGYVLVGKTIATALVVAGLVILAMQGGEVPTAKLEQFQDCCLPSP
jgi:hypothetical protein